MKGAKSKMNWDTSSKECNYSIKLRVTIHHMLPPKDTQEKIEREQMRAHIDVVVARWIGNQKNQQNLMNMILGNTGILI